MTRINRLQQRAIGLLFHDGRSPKAIARAFKVTCDDVYAVLRRHHRACGR